MAHIHQVFDSDAHFSVDPITKTLKNESSQKTTVIQKDHNSERFTFEIPRTIEGHDMSTCNDVKVHYINIDAATKQENKGVYAVDDLQISPEDEEVVICSWLVSGNATQLKGPLAFSISYSCVTNNLDYSLNTAAYKGISVAEGVYCGDYVAEEYADILVQWEEELKNAVTDEQIQEAVNAYLEENPLEETDPTVPDWAKAASKPGYSLSELTEDAEHRTVTDAEKTAWNAKSNFSGSYNDLKNIPPAYSLPIATPAVLGGVKPVAATADMSQAVGVDADGLLFTAPGGGGSGGGGASEGVSNETTYTEGVAYTFDWIEKTAISDGAETTNNGKKATPYLYCAGVADLLIDVTVSWSSGSYSAWYDKDKNYISSFAGTKTAGVTLLKVPVNAAYFRISTNNDVEAVIKPYAVFHTGWRYLRTVTIPEDITTDTSGVSFVATTDGGAIFSFDTDEFGNPFEITDVFCNYNQHLATPVSTLNMSSVNLLNKNPPVYTGDSSLRVTFPMVQTNGTANKRGWGSIENVGGYLMPKGGYDGGTGMTQQYASRALETNAIILNAICLMPVSNTDKGFAPGSTFTFYGRDLK